MSSFPTFSIHFHCCFFFCWSFSSRLEETKRKEELPHLNGLNSKLNRSHSTPDLAKVMTETGRLSNGTFYAGRNESGSEATVIDGALFVDRPWRTRCGARGRRRRRCSGR